MNLTYLMFPLIALIYIALPTLLFSLLQLFLCRKELKWGRILPIFSLVFSLVLPLYLLFISLQTEGSHWSILLYVLASWIIYNIPTLIYYLIYRAAKKKRTQEDLNRTRIDDLE